MTTDPPRPSRGDIWLAALDPVAGHEQAGARPCLVISDDLFNHGPADLVVILPITSSDPRQILHVAVEAPEGGLQRRSFVRCDQIRTIPKGRLVRRWGAVSPDTLCTVAARIRDLLAV